MTIGRDAKNTIALDSRAVSKAHAIVELRNGEYTVQDLESANGTRVNGELTLVRVLEAGDELQVGDVTLTFLDLGGDVAPAAIPDTASPGGKFVRLALTALLTMVVMVGAMMLLLNPPGKSDDNKPKAVEAPLAPASPELLASLRDSAESSLPVQETLKAAAMTGVPPAQALYEEGMMRRDDGRWREAAQLMAATLAREPAHRRAGAEFERAASELDRAASKAMAAAEQAQAGLRYDDAQLRADEVLQLVASDDPRYARASRIADEARAQLRQR